MGFLALLNHAINFVAPAAWLALLMPLVSRIFMKKRPVAHTYKAQAAMYIVANMAVLLLGLVLFGHDGQMLTYLAMVLLSATVAWVMGR